MIEYNEVNAIIQKFRMNDFFKKQTMVNVLIVADHPMRAIRDERNLDFFLANLLNDKHFGFVFKIIFGFRMGVFDNHLRFKQRLHEVVFDLKFESCFFQDLNIPGRKGRNKWQDLDAIFLFGFTNENRLSDEENEFLGDLMNQGVGVFACGDHGKLGNGLCGGIPRIRHMQRWNDREPETEGTSRLRSIQDQSTMVWQGERFFESDSVPARIYHRFYRSLLRSAPDDGSLEREFNRFGLTHRDHPHPLFSGSSELGDLDAIPDHAHEGELIDPAAFAVRGIDSDEFPMFFSPASKECRNLLWEIVAATQNTAFQSLVNDSSFYGNLEESADKSEFGVLACYNGFLIEEMNIGRIVVDSSFHHWLDGNIFRGMYRGRRIQFPNNILRSFLRDDGFALPENRLDFEKIKRLHKNIVIWLLRRKTQRRVFTELFFRTLFWPEMIDGLIGNFFTTNPPKPIAFFRLGAWVLRVLEQRFGRTMPRSWLSIFASDKSVFHITGLYQFDLQNRFEIFLYGGIYFKLIRHLIKISNKERGTNTEKLIEKVEAGFKLGTCEFLKHARLETKSMLDLNGLEGCFASAMCRETGRLPNPPVSCPDPSSEAAPGAEQPQEEADLPSKTGKTPSSDEPY